jgi:PAS domain S-box-containing protein
MKGMKSDQRLKGQDLKESEERYRKIVSAVTDYIYTVHITNHKVVGIDHNSVCEAVTGYSADEFGADPDLWFNLIVEEDRDRFREHECRILTGEKVGPIEYRIRQKDGTMRWVINTPVFHHDTSGAFFTYDVVIRDISGLKLLEEEKEVLEARLLKARRFESIGTFVSGIVHDFNNILSALIGFTELALDDISDPATARRDLKEVLAAGDKARDLVHQILTFSHCTGEKHLPVSLKTIIKESIKMLRPIIPANIEIRQNLITSGLVMSDPTQISQVIMNLCTNAAHAMSGTCGVLEVGLKNVNEVDVSATGLNLPPGSYVKLSISDTGHGMTPEIIARIFDPYFTTKEEDGGTGLGLAVVHRIVKDHGGAVTCKSGPGKGTTFDIYLPEV